MPIKFSENVMLHHRPHGKFKAVSTRHGKKRTLCSNCTKDQIIKQAVAIKAAYKARG